MAIKSKDDKDIFYVTKYALTEGVLKVHGVVASTCKTMILYRTTDSTFEQYAHDLDWYRTQQGAENRFADMRAAKLKSLQRQIKKISGLQFTVRDHTESK